MLGVKLNPFPKMTQLSHKDNLGKLILKGRKIFGLKCYDYHPVTFSNFPQDLKSLYKEVSQIPFWIFKPSNRNNGYGIKVLHGFGQIKDAVENNEEEKFVIQQYIRRPLLIDGYKVQLTTIIKNNNTYFFISLIYVSTYF